MGKMSHIQGSIVCKSKLMETIKVNRIYSRTPFTYIFLKKIYVYIYVYVYMGVRIHMCTIFLKV